MSEQTIAAEQAGQGNTTDARLAKAQQADTTAQAQQ
jgi:hypothetical protein